MFKWPDSATFPASWHVAACGAAGRVTGASRPRDGARRTRRLDVFPSPPVRLHTRKRHTAPSVASGGDGARRRGPGQHRGVDGARGGCCGPFRGPGDLPRAARTLPGQRERQIGPSGAKTLIQTSDGGARPLRAGQDLPRLLAGACGRPSPEDTREAQEAVLPSRAAPPSQTQTLRTTSGRQLVGEMCAPRDEALTTKDVTKLRAKMRPCS